MAVILPGPLISNIRGTIGGVSFHAGRAGIVASRRVAQSKSKTVLQSESQITFYSGISLFRALSTSDKILWNDYALAYPHENKFGQQRILTGQNYFFALNYYRVFMGETPFTQPPARVLPVTPGPYTVTLTSTAIEINFTPAFNPASCGIIIFATPPISTVTNSQRSKWRILEGDISSPYTFYDITASWEAKTGLNYASIAASGIFNIGVMILTFNLSSGVYSPGLINLGFPPTVPAESNYYYYT